MSQETILSVEALRVNFYTFAGVVQAIQDVGFNIRRQSTVGLVGETGCGKSVTASAILRTLPEKTAKIENGSILFKGRDILNLSEKEMARIRGKEISMVFQDAMTSLNPSMKIGLQIEEALRLHSGLSGRDRKRAVIEALRSVELPDPDRIARSFPIQLSGGMCQRCMIAMAISCDPDLLILDEPTTALDVTIQAQIFQLLRNLQENRGLTMLIITHDLGVIAEMCDEVAVMYAGNIVEAADIATLFSNPRHPYTLALLGAIPDMADVNETLRTLPGAVPHLVTPPSGCRFHPRCAGMQDICKEEIPKRTLLSNNHLVFCHLV
jgi:oligopeptide/dipeptide ABC transporter ATP-binding protein